MAAVLPDWPAAVLTAAGTARVRHGALVGPDVCTSWVTPAAGTAPQVRLLDADGRLIALAAWRGALLHPSVVLV
jgi:hypothetical protein